MIYTVITGLLLGPVHGQFTGNKALSGSDV